MKTHYKTLWELFDDLGEEFKFEVPIITGGIGYGQYMKYRFDIGHQKKLLHVQIYRLESGTYEYNGYVL